jgi:uncharacterized protein (TIGR03083 family)
MNHHEHCDALETEVGRFADVLDAVAGETVVESCPGWCVVDVAEHLGTIHRWADQLVRRRAAERLTFESLGLETVPVTSEWIRGGGRQLVDTLRHADPDEEMWAWGADHHVRFWSRRQLHETLVHRMDVELAAGGNPEAEPVVAVDAIDEFLVNLASASYFSPGVLKLRGEGERLGLRDLDTGARWTVALLPDRFDVDRVDDGDAADVDAAIVGPSVALLLALYRRRGPDEFGVRVEGDRRVADLWLQYSALG